MSKNNGKRKIHKAFHKSNRFRKMAAGCCGVKKQKLNDSRSMPSACCNGTSIHPNNYIENRVVCPEMCYFCFDTLYSHLNNQEPPKPPSFPNDA